MAIPTPQDSYGATDESVLNKDTTEVPEKAPDGPVSLRFLQASELGVSGAAEIANV